MNNIGSATCIRTAKIGCSIGTIYGTFYAQFLYITYLFLDVILLIDYEIDYP